MNMDQPPRDKPVLDETFFFGAGTSAGTTNWKATAESSNLVELDEATEIEIENASAIEIRVSLDDLGYDSNGNELWTVREQFSVSATSLEPRRVVEGWPAAPGGRVTVTPSQQVNDNAYVYARAWQRS